MLAYPKQVPLRCATGTGRDDFICRRESFDTLSEGLERFVNLSQRACAWDDGAQRSLTR